MTDRTEKEQEIVDWLRERLAKPLEMEPAEISVDEPFARLGVDSTEAVVISGELEELLGVRMPPTVGWDHPTIAALAAHLAGKLS